jgi:hypothetical protein
MPADEEIERRESSRKAEYGTRREHNISTIIITATVGIIATLITQQLGNKLDQITDTLNQVAVITNKMDSVDSSISEVKQELKIQRDLIRNLELESAYGHRNFPTPSPSQ